MPTDIQAKAVEGFLNYPLPIEYDVPYKPPPEFNNPVVRGLPLSIGASIISTLGILQSHLYNNARFPALRDAAGLENVEPRYDPTVTPLSPSPPAEDCESKETQRPVLNASPLSGCIHRTAADYHDAYLKGSTTPSAVVEALLPLIRRDVPDPSPHSVAFLSVDVERVRAAAEASTQRYRVGKPLGPLDGVPVAVKDEVDLEGYPRCLGMKWNESNKEKAKETSWCIKMWEKQGAVVVGKTNMHELGLDTTNNNPNHGTPLNPHNRNYYSGGSSGGSAYAVAAGLVPIAHGADGGGSIRIPSSYCGLYGLKPTHNRVSGLPTPRLAASTGVHGAIAASPQDLALAYRVMSQPNPSDAFNSQFPSPSPPLAPLTPPQPKLLGICESWISRASPSVRALHDAAVTYSVQHRGYTTIPITIPHHPGQLAHALTILTEISHGPLQQHTNTVSHLTPANQILLRVASRAPATDFLAAQKLRTRLMQHLAFLWRQHPGLLILSPVTPNPGWPVRAPGSELARGLSDANMSCRAMEYVWLANFTGAPAAAAPMGCVPPEPGMGGNPIPVGVMAMAEWGAEEALLGWCGDMEGLAEKKGMRRPEAWEDVLGAAIRDSVRSELGHGGR